MQINCIEIFLATKIAQYRSVIIRKIELIAQNSHSFRKIFYQLDPHRSANLVVIQADTVSCHGFPSNFYSEPPRVIFSHVKTSNFEQSIQFNLLFQATIPRDLVFARHIPTRGARESMIHFPFSEIRKKGKAL